MSYDPAEADVRDQIRGMVGDTDEAAEYFPDVTYDAVIARYPLQWKSAAAEMAGRVAVYMSTRPIAVASEGDSIRFSEEQVKAMYALQATLAEEVAYESASYGIDTTDLNYLTMGYDEWLLTLA